MEQNQNRSVLPGPNSPIGGSLSEPISAKIKKNNYSALGIFLAIILLAIMIMLGERLIFDLNRFVNPVIDKEYSDWQNQKYSGMRDYQFESPKTPVRSMEMTMDAAGAVSKTRIYYPANQKGQYMMYKLIIHAAVIIPLFILAFALFYFKKNNKQIKAILVSFLFFAFWMMFHLLGETTSFVMDQYKNVAIYIILIILAVVFSVLAYYTQVKHSKENIA